MSDKVKCGNCGVELTAADKTCPTCGSTKKAYEEIAEVTIGVKVGTEVTHEAKMRGLKWTILGVVFGLPFSIILLVIGSLNLGAWKKGLIAFGVLLFVGVVLWIGRYQLIMFLRCLNNAFTGKRTFRGK